MLGFGGNLMLWKHFGVGAEVSIQPGQQNYLALPVFAGEGLTSDEIQSRTTFYDFNGIFQPVKSKKASLDFSGGIGGANHEVLRGRIRQHRRCSATRANVSQYFESANHFQVRGGVGVQFYLTDHIFLRPEFDVHYVNNLNQFGSKLVTQEMVWVGYSFGGQ